MRGFGKRLMSPIAARKLAATITFTPGTVISRGSPAVKRVLRDQPLDRGDLGVEEIDLAQPAVDGLAFLDRQLELGQPPPALHAEQICDRRAAVQPAHQDRVDLVLRPRARPHQLPATRQPTAHHPRLPSGIHTASSDPAANSLASVRASSRSVFARA